MLPVIKRKKRWVTGFWSPRLIENVFVVVRVPVNVAIASIENSGLGELAIPALPVRKSLHLPESGQVWGVLTGQGDCQAVSQDVELGGLAIMRGCLRLSQVGCQACSDSMGRMLGLLCAVEPSTCGSNLSRLQKKVSTYPKTWQLTTFGDRIASRQHFRRVDGAPLRPARRILRH